MEKKRSGRPKREGELFRLFLVIDQSTNEVLRDLKGDVPMNRFIEKLIMEEKERRDGERTV